MEPKQTKTSKTFIVAIGDCNYGAGRSKAAALRQARAWFREIREPFKNEHVEYFELSGYAARYAMQHRDDGGRMGTALSLPQIECPNNAVICTFGYIPFGVGKTRREALAAAREARARFAHEQDEGEIGFYKLSGVKAALAYAAAEEGLSGQKLHSAITDPTYSRIDDY